MKTNEDPRIASASFKANPYPFYAQLRRDTPVKQLQLNRREHAFVVARYADVSAMLRNPRLAKDPANAMTAEQLARHPSAPKIFQPLTRNLLALDDPDHTRLKRLVQATFTPRRVQQLEAKTTAISTALLERLTGRRFDLISDYAVRLPVTVISDLLGVPKPDQPRFARWSRALIRNSTPSFSLLLSLPEISPSSATCAVSSR